MKRIAPIFLIGLLTLGSVAVTSCADEPSVRLVGEVDSLNAASYAARYRDLARTERLAGEALRRADEPESAPTAYPQGRVEALQQLAFVAFMRMDFERAMQLYARVEALTDDPLERLIVNVGRMKICQRTALNKEFYDYRNAAQRLLDRVDAHPGRYSLPRQRRRVGYARSEFHIVTAVYHYYLQQRPDALTSMERQADDEALAADTAQWLYYHYIKGASQLCYGRTAEERRLHEFDELSAVCQVAHGGGYGYFEGNALQGLANLLVSPADYRFFAERRPYDLAQLAEPMDTLLPLRLAGRALSHFRRYGDLYQIAGAYVTMGRYLNMHGRYAEALDTLGSALECVNLHHRTYYHCTDSLDWLYPFNPEDSASIERRWMAQRLMTVPEWISRIREQLSVSYAGLGEKQPSDYNRNIYLDILEDTRQDREWESRYQELERESAYLTGLLTGVGVIFLLLVGAFWLFHRRSLRRGHRHRHRLQQILQLCRKIVESVPAEAADTDRLQQKLLQLTAPELKQLFGTAAFSISDGQLSAGRKLRRDERAMLDVINPYIRWAVENGQTAWVLTEEIEHQEELRELHRHHIARHKRSNLLKKTCVAVVDSIQPFIDRILHEVHLLQHPGNVRLTEADRRLKYEYIDELVTIINERNDILARWIKMKQGTLSLNIESFELNPLFDLLRKGSRAFEMKHLSLTVEPTDAWVKADRALTLFMINTLADNARKYTPEGGSVCISAHATESYVEIAVADTGCGYEPHTDSPSPQRGSGFGLMNCRGIIEKYRKTSSLFEVCLLDVESKAGQGSRFFFRLPVGGRKVLTLLALCLGMGLSAAARTAGQGYEALLNQASDYANEAYFCNVDGDYEQALCYADSAMQCLNRHYRRYYGGDASPCTMQLVGRGSSAELQWWKSRFDTDYHIILDLRNESAVAFLALRQWDAYTYNNNAYTSLFKLLGEDHQLEAYCYQLLRSTEQKQVILLLMVLLICTMPVGYYLFYLRKLLRQRRNLHRVVSLNLEVFASASPQGETFRLTLAHDAEIDALYSGILQSAHDAVAKLCHQNLDVELLQDEARRAQWEDSQLHVQNQVLDNCLSTIKHETAYYPNKIKQLVSRLQASGLDTAQAAAEVDAIAELIEYYKGVFTTLSTCASRQMEEVTFRRTTVEVAALVAGAERYFARRSKGRADGLALSVSLPVGAEPVVAVGDDQQLQFLFENLIDEALEAEVPGGAAFLSLGAEEGDDGFVTFTFTDPRRTLTAEQLHHLFYPQRERGMQFLVCKQIIREHDEYTGFRGCRIQTFPAAGGTGFSIRFSVPSAGARRSSFLNP